MNPPSTHSSLENIGRNCFSRNLRSVEPSLIDRTLHLGSWGASDYSFTCHSLELQTDLEKFPRLCQVIRKTREPDAVLLFLQCPHRILNSLLTVGTAGASELFWTLKACERGVACWLLLSFSCVAVSPELTLSFFLNCAIPQDLQRGPVPFGWEVRRLKMWRIAVSMSLGL